MLVPRRVNLQKLRITPKVSGTKNAGSGTEPYFWAILGVGFPLHKPYRAVSTKLICEDSSILGA